MSEPANELGLPDSWVPVLHGALDLWEVVGLNINTFGDLSNVEVLIHGGHRVILCVGTYVECVEEYQDTLDRIKALRTTITADPAPVEPASVCSICKKPRSECDSAAALGC